MPLHWDNACAQQPDDQALKALQQYYTKHWQDPKSPYSVKQDLQEVRQNVCTLLGSEDLLDWIPVVSEADADQQVLEAVYRKYMYPQGKNHVLFAPSCIAVKKWVHAYEALGCQGSEVQPNPEGQITVECLKSAMNPRLSLLVMPWVDPFSGVVHPIWEIGDFCKEQGILLYVQGSDILGRAFFRLEDIHLDFFSFEGSAIGAPRGIGGLFIHPHSRGSALLEVPSLEESPLLSQTQCLAQACREMYAQMDTASIEVAQMRELMESQLKQAQPQLHIWGASVQRVYSQSAFGLPPLMGEALAYRLWQKGVTVSIQSRSGQRYPEHSVSCMLPLTISEAQIQQGVEIITDTLKEMEPLIEGVSV